MMVGLEYQVNIFLGQLYFAFHDTIIKPIHYY